MANSVAIPQDIIYHIIEAVASDDDRDSLEQCALVSSSFLLPCRKHLFSELSLGHHQVCQEFHQFLVENPVVLSFVRSISLYPTRSFEYNYTSLVAILRLPFCCLENFSINMSSLLILYPWDWNDFSSELKDALSTVIHASTLKTLYVENIHVPIMLFLGLNLRLAKLEMTAFFPTEYDDEQSRLLTPAASEGVATTASHTVVDYCVCRYYRPVYGTRFSTTGYFSLI